MPEHHTHPEEPRYYEEHYDEIDLADVALAIWRRRWLFVGTFLAVFGLSVAYAFLATPVYDHRTTLEIGYIPTGFGQDGDDQDSPGYQRIETAQNVKDRMERLYIPAVLHDLRNEYDEAISPDSIQVSVPERSGIVELSREASDSASGRTLDLLNRVVQRVKSDHDGIFDLIFSQHQAELTSARNALEGLKSEEAVIQADLERIDSTAELLKNNIESLESSIQRMEEQRQQVASIASNEEKAMTLLLIDNQIQNNQRRLEDLRERLEVDLEQERDQLENALSDNQRAQQNKEQSIATLEAKGQAMKRTSAVIPPTQSVNPVSPNKRLILALGFVLAGMLGVLVVGIHGLLARARRKMEQEDTAAE